MKKQKKVLSLILTVLIVLSLATGCGGNNSQPISNSSNPIRDEANENTELTPEQLEAQKNFAASTPENDTDVGLKNIKIDTADCALSDEQKAVLAYFDDDYLTVPGLESGYEFLRRYPQIFEGSQLSVWGSVKKVISMDSDHYEMVLWLNIGPAEFEYAYDYPEYEGNYVLLAGKTGDTWFMEGDALQIYGRYSGIETVEIDGKSYTIPKIEVHKELIDPSPAPNDIYRYIEKFSATDVKKVAEAVFGNNIEVRRPIAGIDLPEWQLSLWQETSGGNDFCYTVELENQSNAKFTKYFFFTGDDISAVGGTRITDAKDAMSETGTAITRTLEFAADFEHYFLFTYDSSLETLNLAYYDKSLNKVWDREFPETTSAAYDYTKNNIYLVANNEFYIINIETGEDTFTPTYIGKRLEIRKLSDGIVCVSESKSDAVMKMDINGSMVWKTNLSAAVYEVQGIQIIKNTIVLQLYLEDGMHYVALDSETGAVLQDAVSLY